VSFFEGHFAPRPELFLLSANTSLSLKDQIERYREFTQRNPALSTSDLAYTLATRREKLPHRAYAIVEDGVFTETSGLVKVPAKPADIYLIFSGQGAQWPGMAKELVHADPLFKTDIELMDAVLQRLAHPPAWRILGKRYSG
jgi:acyl transferase domain-containing protein